MKIAIPSLTVLLLFALLTGCKSNISSADQKNSPLPDGIYLLLNEFPDKQSIKRVKGRVIPYSHLFLDDNTEGQPEYFDIHPDEYVPLILAETPDSITQADKRIHLMLTLTPDAKDDLADFTEKHINKRVAIVIGGEGMTKHKVRTRIDGGKLQITRCTDNACEYLFMELRDNVQK